MSEPKQHILLVILRPRGTHIAVQRSTTTVNQAVINIIEMLWE